MVDTIKIWAWCGFNDEKDETYNFNASTIHSDGHGGAVFRDCMSSCCTYPSTYEVMTGCERVGDAVMNLMVRGLMGDGDVPTINADEAVVVRPYLKKPANVRKFSKLVVGLRDALNTGVDFDRTITLYR